MPNLDGQVALITGASRGIGEATAECLAKYGASVVLAARSTKDIEAIAERIVADGGKAVAISCDVSRYEDLVAAVKLCQEAFGGLDILVNNAGVIDPIARLESSDPQGWGTVIDINVKGVYHGIRAAIEPMLAAGKGTIINISSGAATGALEGWSHYCASKAAVLSLTKCANVEFGDKGIRVMGLSPGTVRTEMQVAIKHSGINAVSQLDPNVHIPPSWVAEAIAWLTTPAGDEYLGTDCSLRDPNVRKAIGVAG